MSSKFVTRNSEDRHIPKKGKITKIMAKNLLTGDKFVLNGGKIGRILGVEVVVLHGQKKSRYDVILNIKNSNGKKFTTEIAGKHFVPVFETPQSRFRRRAMSRLPENYRTGYVFV